jgi:hypothetical protein
VLRPKEDKRSRRRRSPVTRPETSTNEGRESSGTAAGSNSTAARAAPAGRISLRNIPGAAEGFVRGRNPVDDAKATGPTGRKEVEP